MAGQEQRLLEQLRAEAHNLAQLRLAAKLLQRAQRKQTTRGYSLIRTTRHES